MGKAIDVVLFVVGVAMVAVAMASAIKSTVLPRAVQNRLVTLVVVSMRLIFRVFLRHAADYERRDRIMAFFGPATLIAELATWMGLIVIGYSLMFLGIETSSFKRAVEIVGIVGHHHRYLGNGTSGHPTADLQRGRTGAGVAYLVDHLSAEHLSVLFPA